MGRVGLHPAWPDASVFFVFHHATPDLNSWDLLEFASDAVYIGIDEDYNKAGASR